MNNHDESERRRLSHQQRPESLSLPSSFGSSRFVGKVISTSPNLVVGKFVNVIPQILLGTEAENQTPIWTDAGSTPVPVMLLGPGVPATGDRILARSTNHRWVSKRKAVTGGGLTGTLLGCSCAHPPATLTMTVSGTVCANGLLNSCTITYRTTPTELGPLHLGTSAYLSTATFADPQTGDLFYYYLGCFSSIIRISRVFPYSIYGSPFLDSVIYFWTIGLPGNTCSPFLLSNGQIFFGGDPSCTVTISG